MRQGDGLRGAKGFGKKYNGVESRMRGCSSSRKLVAMSEGSQVERRLICGEVEGDVRVVEVQPC